MSDYNKYMKWKNENIFDDMIGYIDEYLEGKKK
jgi:hypothetical protein